MPHKVNPIDFENAEGNLKIANFILRGLSTSVPISRLQRDLSGSTMMRNLGVAVGYSAYAYASTLKGLKKIMVDESVLRIELDNHWAVLAEPIQMILRKSGAQSPYEALKAVTRGASAEAQKNNIQQFVAALSGSAGDTDSARLNPEGDFDIQGYCNAVKLSPQDGQALLDLTPHSYVGNAAEMAKNVRAFLGMPLL
eukprot:GHVQ01008930.1.p1 GENE.GHVQ01008930.1~~GHVQ01008930.1.p1  ORF type:complete len:197 (-),score=9.07 GHVQ01008930.1:1480-2070(-)